jgi:hypothetical protein
MTIKEVGGVNWGGQVGGQVGGSSKSTIIQ